MTQQPLVQQPDLVAHEQVDATIAATVLALIHGRKLRVVDVAVAVGMSGTGLYNKLNVERPFKASEVAQLAEYLGVGIIDLYTGLGGMFSPTPGSPSDARARQGSNLRPSAYKVVDLDDWVARQSQPAPAQVRPAA